MMRACTVIRAHSHVEDDMVAAGRSESKVGRLATSADAGSLTRLRGGFTLSMHRGRCSQSHQRNPPLGQLVALAAGASEPDFLDSALAATGAAVGVAALTLVQHWLPLKLWTAGVLQGVYVTTLCSSAIILNFGDAPPDFLAVFWATFVPAAVTVGMMRLTRSSALVRPLSVLFTMLWFKLNGCAFPPAAALANTFLDNPTCAPMGWAYVTLPCTGNAILWAVAYTFSLVRARVRSRGRKR